MSMLTSIQWIVQPDLDQKAGISVVNSLVLKNRDAVIIKIYGQNNVTSCII